MVAGRRDDGTFQKPLDGPLMQGTLIDLSFGLNGKQRLTIELSGDFQADFQILKDSACDIEIKKHREKRSRNANAYFHVLVNKMAAVLGEGNEERKKKLVVEYGALARDEDGRIIGVMLPEKVNADSIYKYNKQFDTKVMNGRRYICYLLYKETHTLDTKEMSRLIDGTVSEAQELDIETLTPAELERMKNEWRNNYGAREND